MQWNDGCPILPFVIPPLLLITIHYAVAYTSWSEAFDAWKAGPGAQLLDKNGAIRDPDCSVFPIEIPGISSIGTNDVEANLRATEQVYDPDPYYARIQSVSFSVEFGFCGVLLTKPDGADQHQSDGKKCYDTFSHGNFL